MKQILSLLIAALVTLSSSQAADPAPKHTYQGEVAGVVCFACAAKVKAGLGKLPGVESVKVLAGEKPGLAKLVIITTADSLTKDAANKALGEDGQHYIITSLDLVKNP